MRRALLAASLCVAAIPALAADPAQINGLAADWGAMARLNEHVAQGLQSLAKQYQETDAALTAEREYWKGWVSGDADAETQKAVIIGWLKDEQRRANETKERLESQLSAQYREAEDMAGVFREYWKRYVEGLGAPKAGDGTVNLAPPGVTPK